MNKPVKFSVWSKMQIRHDQPVCIIGGGTSMDQYVNYPQHFHLLYRDVIGVNWTFLDFWVDYVVCVHKAVVLKHANLHPISHLVYSKKAAELKYRFLNPIVPGIVFNRGDLFLGSSSAVMAIDFATRITTGDIHIYGVDLGYQGDRMYYNGYFQQDKRKPSKPDFEAWAERVKGQIVILCKERSNSLIFHNLTTNIL